MQAARGYDVPLNSNYEFGLTTPYGQTDEAAVENELRVLYKVILHLILMRALLHSFTALMS